MYRTMQSSWGTEKQMTVWNLVSLATSDRYKAIVLVQNIRPMLCRVKPRCPRKHARRHAASFKDQHDKTFILPLPTHSNVPGVD